jgi:hypothetical protein
MQNERGFEANKRVGFDEIKIFDLLMSNINSVMRKEEGLLYIISHPQAHPCFA